MKEAYELRICVIFPLEMRMRGRDDHLNENDGVCGCVGKVGSSAGSSFEAGKIRKGSGL